jgi:hypothetical protein
MASLSLGCSAVVHSRRLLATVVNFNSNGAFAFKGGAAVNSFGNSISPPWLYRFSIDHAYHSQRRTPGATIVFGPPEHARVALLTIISIPVSGRLVIAIWKKLFD